MSLSLTTQLELQAGAQIVAFDSSTQGKTYRVELTDGRHFQVNEKLYHLLDALRTAMTLPDLAAAIHQRTGQTVAPGTILGTIQETAAVEHRILVPPDVRDRKSVV